MTPRLALLSLGLLAQTMLTGCVAVAIPALAGSAILGSRTTEGDDSQTVPVPAPAPAAADLAPAPAQPRRAPSPLPPLFDTPSLASDPSVFAQFVRYSSTLALSPDAQTGARSAVLADPVALDGERRSCAADSPLMAIIDLDPAGGLFDPAASPAAQPVLVRGLSMLREAGVAIAWFSDLPASETAALRTALAQSGLDPRGEDIVSLGRDSGDRKQARKDSLAASACILAIAGDERADFDERFRYLRNPEAGVRLEPIIGDGWFLIDPVFPIQGPQGQ